jgi:hypothetical protein
MQWCVPVGPERSGGSEPQAVERGASVAEFVDFFEGMLPVVTNLKAAARTHWQRYGGPDCKAKACAP